MSIRRGSDDTHPRGEDEHESELDERRIEASEVTPRELIHQTELIPKALPVTRRQRSDAEAEALRQRLYRQGPKPPPKPPRLPNFQAKHVKNTKHPQRERSPEARAGRDMTMWRERYLAEIRNRQFSSGQRNREGDESEDVTAESEGESPPRIRDTLPPIRGDSFGAYDVPGLAPEAYTRPPQDAIVPSDARVAKNRKKLPVVYNDAAKLRTALEEIRRQREYIAQIIAPRDVESRAFAMKALRQADDRDRDEITRLRTEAAARRREEQQRQSRQEREALLLRRPIPGKQLPVNSSPRGAVPHGRLQPLQPVPSVPSAPPPRVVAPAPRDADTEHAGQLLQRAEVLEERSRQSRIAVHLEALAAKRRAYGLLLKSPQRDRCDFAPTEVCVLQAFLKAFASSYHAHLRSRAERKAPKRVKLMPSDPAGAASDWNSPQRRTSIDTSAPLEDRSKASPDARDGSDSKSEVPRRPRSLSPSQSAPATSTASPHPTKPRVSPDEAQTPTGTRRPLTLTEEGVLYTKRRDLVRELVLDVVDGAMTQRIRCHALGAIEEETADEQSRPEDEGGDQVPDDYVEDPRVAYARGADILAPRDSWRLGGENGGRASEVRSGSTSAMSATTSAAPDPSLQLGSSLLTLGSPEPDSTPVVVQLQPERGFEEADEDDAGDEPEAEMDSETESKESVVLAGSYTVDPARRTSNG